MSAPMCLSNTSLCSKLSSSCAVAVLAERDASYPASVDQAALPGIDVNTLIFSRTGYVSNSTVDIFDALDTGFRSLYMDTWWDAQRGWQLCPQYFPSNATSGVFTLISQADNSSVVCDLDLTLPTVFKTIRNYINATDTNVAVNLLSLVLRPRYLVATNSSQSTSSFQLGGSLQDSLLDELSPRIYSPGDLASSRSPSGISNEGTDRSGTFSSWPSLTTILLAQQKRMVVTIDPTFIPASSLINTGAKSLFYFGNPEADMRPPGHIGELPDLSSPLSAADASALSNQSFRSIQVDQSETALKDWSSIVFGGYSPVLNTTVPDSTIVDCIEQSWSWRAGSPELEGISTRTTNVEEQHLLMCAFQQPVGLEVGNCNDRKPLLCREYGNWNSWRLSSDHQTYFDQDCGSNFYFGAPRTSLEGRIVRQLTGNASVWVDMSSLSLPNCWITGGYYAICPYSTAEGTSNGIALLSVAGAVSLLLISLMVLIEWDGLRLPLRHRKRKRSRKHPLPDAHSSMNDGVAA